MNRDKKILLTFRSTYNKAIAVLLASFLILSISVPEKAFAQYVPPVGPSSCVWGCGGAAVSGGMGNMNMGGLFGGIAAMGIPLLLNALTSSSSSTSPAIQQQQQEALEAQKRAEALRKALEEQKRIQEERHNRLVSSLIDIPSAQLIDAPDRMSFLDRPLEQMAAGAGRIFDGTAEPDAFWMKNHDAWFSTLGYTAQPVSTQPLPTGEQPLNYTEEQFKQLECVGPTPYGGQVCPFPNMRVSVTEMQTIEVPAPDSSSGFSRVISQFSEVKGRFVSAFRGSWSNLPTPSEKIPDLIMNNFVDKVNETIPGLQGEVAAAGQGIIKNVMLNTANHFFSQLNQSLVNPDAAIAMGEPEALRGVIRGSVAESLKESAVEKIKELPWLALTERYEVSTEKPGVVPLLNVGPHPDAARWEFHKLHWINK